MKSCLSPVFLRRGLTLFVGVGTLFTLISFSTTGNVNAAPQRGRSRVQAAIEGIEHAAGARARVIRSRPYDLPTFLRFTRGRGVKASGRLPRERARSFIHRHGQAFGLERVTDMVVRREQHRDRVGMDHVRFQQLHRGVPVTGAELVVHLKDASVQAVNGHSLPADDLERVDVSPVLTPDDALAETRELLEARLEVLDAELSQPRLEVFNRGLLDQGDWPTRLAWFVKARTFGQLEYVWIDAQDGGVLLHFNQLPNAKERRIHAAEGTQTLPGTLVRTEGDPPTGIVDADLAYDYLGDTYDYYWTEHGRDSFDDAGSVLIATVGYPDYNNAAWNGGGYVVIGEGYVADDVVAHEVTHGVTQDSAGFYSYMQSGALDEAFADIFGEIVDLRNHAGTDTPDVRWLHGEDLPYGANRYMWDPPKLDQAGKMSDPEFVCNPTDDRGGVHSNSGIPSHAFALMVDGGTYNDFTINGIGLDKAGKVYYRALTEYLVAASDFLDLYEALQQSCSDLVGIDGITAADCAEVRNALDAVEMSDPWPCSSVQTPKPEACPGGIQPQYVFFDDFESGFHRWQVGGPGSDVWSIGMTVATSGIRHLSSCSRGIAIDAWISMGSDVAIPSSGAFLRFDHLFSFPPDISEGGVLEYSVDAGSSWQDAGPLMTAGTAYNGAIPTTGGNPLGGRQAFVANSYGYTVTQLDLSSLAGQSVRFRFRIGSGGGQAGGRWYVDDVAIYSCDCRLNVATTGSGAGTVTSHEGSIQCPTNCIVVLPIGTEVSLTATPDEDSTFSGWLGACVGREDCVLTLDKPKSVTAAFDTPNTHSLMVATAAPYGGGGSVTSSLPGISCGTDCDESYVEGTGVILTAVPEAGSLFLGWSGDCTGVGACVLTMDTPKSITATFEGSHIPKSERDALIALYNATNGPSWIRHDNWLGPPGTEKDWYGITTDSGNTTVLRIDLDSNGLHGSIPAELGDFANLQLLSMFSNRLTGSIPGELGNLTNLQALSLFSNRLTGPIPGELGNLTNLESLDLIMNRLTGPIPGELGNITNLQYLGLYWNQLTGPIPKELGRLIRLRDLDLRSNQLRGIIPSELQNLLNIWNLDLRWNALRATDPDLLAFLSSKAAGWEATQTVPPDTLAAAMLDQATIELTWMPILYADDAGGYRLHHSTSSGGPYTLYGVTTSKSDTSMIVENLNPGTTYYFVINTVTAPHTANINRVVSDESLEASATTASLSLSVSKAGPGDGTVTSSPAGIDCGSICSAAFPQDSVVTLTATPASGSSFVGWDGACSGHGDCVITMDSSKSVIATFERSIPQEERDALIALYNATNGPSWTNRENWLGPPGTEKDWYGITTDSTNTTVLRIDLHSNALSGTIPTELTNLTSLQHLDLVGNQLIGSIPGELGNLTNLQNLYLASNQLTGAIPGELGNLTTLQRLNLYSNQLGGPIPTDLGNLTNLLQLRLSSNQLTGAIPPELGRLVMLTELNLRANQLRGIIPSDLQNLLNTTSLDLRWNALRANDPDLLAFLSSKAAGWEATQTVPPDALAAMSLDHKSVSLSWTPIPFTAYQGGYRVHYGTSGGDPYTLYGVTASKSDTLMVVENLNPGTTYYFVIETVTEPHSNNANQVVSEKSPEVSATTRTGMLGDVDSSGVVDNVDAQLTAEYYVGLDPTGFNPDVADVDGSGMIDIIDALLIAQYHAGVINTFPE